MNQPSDSCTLVPRFFDLCRNALATHPCARGTGVVTRSPASADVMGGIVEDSGALVLTTTLATTITTGMWSIGGSDVRLSLVSGGGNGEGKGSAREFRLAASALDPSTVTATALLATCREAGCDWAAPTCLTLRQVIAEGLIPQACGLMILLQSDFPADADLGRPWVQAAATIEGLCRIFGLPVDRLQKSRICAEAVFPMTGLYNLRTPMTALCGPPDGALLQLRFYPQPLCQAMELPPGMMISAASTHLTRPTTPQRLIETRMCAEIGRWMIGQLQQLDGARGDPAMARLAAITPAEYVERYRDRLPSKITGKAFLSKFGSLRGLNGELNPQAIYKVRSRAEHHIYENKRVHEFATCIARAKRTNSAEALVHAGELMYASHWSHSQRCGIGGVEADQLVSAIRAHGPRAGLFGAKVTAGGEGGELVVLMRDDPTAHAALADAIARMEATSKQIINTFRGPMSGAEFFQSPELLDAAAAAAVPA